MRIFKRNENKETGKLPMGRKSRKAFAVYVAAVLCMTCFTTTAFAASDPLTVVNNLSAFIFGFIRPIGMLVLVVGIVQIVLRLNSHAPSQRGTGFMPHAGVAFIPFATDMLA